MIEIDGPYALLWLKSVERREVHSGELLLPLALAYCCSSFVRVRFPFPSIALREVERAFDRVLPELAVRSKGIGYVMDCNSAERQLMLTDAALILTTDAPPAEFSRRPHLLIRDDEIERQFTDQLSHVNLLEVIAQAKTLARLLRAGSPKGERESERNWNIKHDITETNKRQLARLPLRSPVLSEVSGNLAR